MKSHYFFKQSFFEQVFFKQNVLRLTAIILLAGLLNACASLLKPDLETELVELKAGQYTIDKNHATILFKIDHMGFSKFIGRFNDFDATLDFDADNIANSRLEAVVNMASVDVNNENFEETLRGNERFNTATHPQAFFKTTLVKNISGGSADFEGDLTFLGVTRPIIISVHFNGGATNLLTYKYTIGFSAISRFKRSDFGLDRYIPTVGDEIELEVHAEFQKN